VERRYRLRQDRTSISPETLGSISLDGHRRAFAAAMATLLAAYLETEDADPAADLVGYQQRAVWLSQGELLDLISAMRSAIAPHLETR
jgi:hypothetical protein